MSKESGHFQFAWWEVLIIAPFALAGMAIGKIGDARRALSDKVKETLCLHEWEPVGKYASVPGSMRCKKCLKVAPPKK